MSDVVKFVIGILIFVVLAFGGSWLLVDWAFKTDMRNATEFCAQWGAQPSYTHRTHGVCVLPDGRVTETF